MSHLDLRELAAAAVRKAEAIDLTLLPAGIDALVGPPGNGLGVVQHMPWIGEAELVLFAWRHLHVPRFLSRVLAVPPRP
jgi:hypothetical protein